MDSYISIDGWRSNIRFSSAHIIHEYEKCGRLHGHTYAVHAKIFGKTDEKGIIIDFSILKDVLREIISELDHKLLVPEKSKIIKIKRENNNVKIISKNKMFTVPGSDCKFLPIKSTSAENLSAYILDKFLETIDLPSNIDTIELGVDEGYGQGSRISKRIK